MSEARVVGTYNFREVSVIVGTREITEFYAGSEVMAERDEESFTKQVGVEGNVTRSKSNNSCGTITLSVSQVSEDNKYLQNLANLDERTNAGIFPVKIVDKSNPSIELVTAFQAWISKPANRNYGAESSAREWMIHCADLNFL